MANPRHETADNETQWARWSEVIANNLGLHFPRERWPDLRRGLSGAAHELGFADVAACGSRLLSEPLTRTQLQALASHLTIGETYFFREKKTLDVLATSVLPPLIQARRGRDQRLRLWSAACSSGEEPYSLAILLDQLLPDLADWHVTILATDINPRALQKGVAGSYGEWSFRDTPPGFRDRYFTRTEDRRHAIRPEIKALVTFEHLNLMEDVYPSLATDTNAMDVILCRNVLMYFTPPQIRQVIDKLHHSLIDGGWLAVSPSEASQALFPQFVTRNFPGVILFQKSEAAARDHRTFTPAAPPQGRVFGNPASVRAPAPPASVPPTAAGRPSSRPAATPERSPVAEPVPTPYAVARSLYDQGRYGEAADILLPCVAEGTPRLDAFSLLARALANEGRLADALAWCDRWIAANKIDAAAHYVRAAVLLEHGRHAEARQSLQRTLYLDPDFVLAHFALGNLARSGGSRIEADRHIANTLDLLARLPADQPLPESDGLTAGRLTEIVTAMTPVRPAR